MTRREAGWMVVRAAAVAGGPEFFRTWLNAAQMKPATPHAHKMPSVAPPEPDRWTSYKPQFFSGEEFQTLDAFTAILIPTDDTPGAREAHVAPFIDFVVIAAADYAPEMQQQWRDATKWLTSHEFVKLSADQQIALVQQIFAPERQPGGKHDGFPCYRLIKEMTVHAFYTSRVGLIDVLEYKGNAYLAEFPGCQHAEHHRV